jgi:hypothetical protein
MLSIQERAELESELALLEIEKKKPENDTWEKQLEIQDAAHNIKMKLNGVKPTDSHIDCIGCGS